MIVKYFLHFCVLDVGDVDIARTIQETIAQQKEWNALSAQTWDISQNVVRPTNSLDPLP
jgi:hypothetical protein